MALQALETSGTRGIVLNMASLESQLMTSLENRISLFPANPANLTALAWLACLLCPALAWSGLGLSRLSCRPCLGLVQQQQQQRHSRRLPPKAAGCCCWNMPRQGRQDRPRADQAKARHNKQARGVLAEPGTPRDPKSHILPPIGSLSNRFGHSRWGSMQTFGADLARGFPLPQSQLFCSFF